MTARLDVLVPTRNRPVELATTLSGLAAQDYPSFDVLVSDQSDAAADYATPAAAAMSRVLAQKGRSVRFVRHLPRRGLAEQRAFLLAQASAPYVLFLDDDVWLEPSALSVLMAAVCALGCGFVGFAVQGLSYMADVRRHEWTPYEEWGGRPMPEVVTPTSTAWRRWTLHNAANLTHLADELALSPGEWRAYKVAWVGGCVLYDRRSLRACGGFDFWPRLPVEHAGEDVVAQWRVMARFGGAGILPSLAVHLEAPTTVANRGVEARDVVV